jgi:predicted DNA-binding protein
MVTRRTHFRLHARISSGLGQRLKAYCSATHTTEAAVVEAALQQYLDKTSDYTVMMRRLDVLGRQLERTTRDVRMSAEAFGAFVNIWYAYTPELPDEAKRGAQRQAARRFDAFVRSVALRLGNGRPFLDDLVRDDLFATSDLEERTDPERKPDPEDLQ